MRKYRFSRKTLSAEVEINKYLSSVKKRTSYMLGSVTEEEKYIIHNTKRYIFTLKTIDKLIQNNKKIYSILDIGTSPFTFILKRRYKNLKISTIDYSDKFGKLCKNNKIIFKTVDLNRPKFDLGKEKYDLVTFLEVIEHLKGDHDLILNKIASSIKTSGFCILQTPNKFSPKAHINTFFWNMFSEVSKRSEEFEHFKEYSLDELILKVKNIKNIKIVKSQLTTYFDHPSSTLVYRKTKSIFIPIMNIYYYLVLAVPFLRRGMQVILIKK